MERSAENILSTGKWTKRAAWILAVVFVLMFVIGFWASREPDGFQAWLDEWVTGIADHDAYCAKLGAGLEDLRITGEALAAPVNYAAK